jgi:predicted dehydrogenase
MNTTRWGILGTGTMAQLFAGALVSLPGAKIQAVAARTKQRAEQFAAQFQIPAALEGYESLVGDPAVDVVYISTPNEQHHQNCLLALNAGKAVLCEKPFALSAVEAQQVVDLARAKGIFCMEAMWMRFAPAVREALSLAREGKLGRVEFFSGQLGFPYETDPANRLFRQPGGGALLDLGVYPLSLAQALLGSPNRVASHAALSSNGIDEQFAAVLGYKDGAQAVIAASLKAKLANSASIHGHTGVLQLNDPLYFPEGYTIAATPSHSTKQSGPGRFSKLRRHPLVRALVDFRNRSQIRTVSKRTGESGYSFEAAEVQRCLQGGLKESPEMSWSDTLAVMESVDSIRSQWAAILP